VEITRVSDSELKAVGTIEILGLMNITRVSGDSASNQALGDSYTPFISTNGWFADGQRVAFPSQTTNLVPGDINNILDVFVFDTSIITDVYLPITDILYEYIF